MESLNFWAIVLLAAAGIVLIFCIFMFAAIKHINRQVRLEAEQMAQDIADRHLIALTVEVAGDQFLCYDYQTQDFVCQGRTLAEIKERFAQRFPNKNAAIWNGDEAAMAVLKQQLQDLKKERSAT